jgi:hypothetical protein
MNRVVRLNRTEEAAWFEKALTALEGLGPTGRTSAAFIRRRRTMLAFSRQSTTGAAWFDWRRLRLAWPVGGVFLNADYAGGKPDDPRLCALIAHEAEHLRQGIHEALSVRGELAAWQVHYDVLSEASALPADPLWEALRSLSPDSRADLERARQIMRRIAGPHYRIHWLPLYPLGEEIVYRARKMAERMGRR